MLRSLLPAGLAALMLPASGFGWAETGHHVVARIAAARITDPAVAARILAVLDLESNAPCAQTDLAGRLACVSTWADDARRNGMGFTRNWHFVDVPRTASSYDEKRDCPDTPNGDCVIKAILRLREILLHPPDGTTGQKKAEALKFLVHFIGDLHQPLHSIDDGDQGGNGKTVTWFGEASTAYGHWNLHSVWDAGIIDKSAHPVGLMNESGLTREFAYTRLLLAAEPAIPPSGAFTPANLVSWVMEAHQAGVDFTYGTLPAPRQGKLDGPEQTDRMYYALNSAYLDANLAACELQLRRGGERLGEFLNELFRSNE